MNITTSHELKRVAFTPVVTGFASTTRVDGFYTLEGKQCTVTIDIVGTSDATGFTFTLPFAADPAVPVGLNQQAIRAIDNGAGIGTFLRSRGGSSDIVDVFALYTGGAWTNSGTKGFSATFIYYVE